MPELDNIEYREVGYTEVNLSGFPLKFHELDNGRQAINHADLGKIVSAMQQGFEFPIEELEFLNRVIESFSTE